MKKSILVCVAIGLALTFGSIAMAGTGAPGTGIGNTSHDLSLSATFGDSAERGAGGLNRICIYCHAPHNTVKPSGTNTYMPLWNHAASLNQPIDFTMYRNTITGDIPDNIAHRSQAMELMTVPGSVSLLCLSCHDGSVATNEYGMNSGLSSKGLKDQFIPAGGRASIGFGADLSNHHPIGFDYQSVIDGGDDEINATITDVGATGLTIADLLTKGRMECSTCHDVHNTKNTGEKFLWISDAGSALCLTCHKKNG